MIKIYLLLFYGGVLMLSCNPGTQSSPDAPYYDVKGYISNQIDLLKKRDVPVSKWALFNGKEENVEIEHLNWERELKSFIRLDINKPAWYDSYTIDTTVDFSFSNELRIITYEASNSKLKVRNLVVTLSAENDSVISIVGTVETKNLLSDSEQHLRYESGKGYLISGKEKILFLKEKIYEIEVEY